MLEHAKYLRLKDLNKNLNHNILKEKKGCDDKIKNYSLQLNKYKLAL